MSNALFLLENWNETVFNSVSGLPKGWKPISKHMYLISDVWCIVGCKGAVSDPLALCHHQLKVGKMGLIPSVVGKEEVASGIGVENTNNVGKDCVE